GTALGRISSLIFPPPVFDDQQRRSQHAALSAAAAAQPALAAAGLAVFRLLARCGVGPDFLAGHSFGEYLALGAAGVIQEGDLFRLAEARGRFMAEAANRQPGAMAAVDAAPETVQRLLAELGDVTLANHNAPRQSVIAGPPRAIEASVERLTREGLRARVIPV